MTLTNVFVERLKKLGNGLNVLISLNVVVQGGIILNAVDYPISKNKIWTHWTSFVWVVKGLGKNLMRDQRELKEPDSF